MNFETNNHHSIKLAKDVMCFYRDYDILYTIHREKMNYELWVTIKSIIDNVERGSFALTKINKDCTNDDISVISINLDV